MHRYDVSPRPPRRSFGLWLVVALVTLLAVGWTGFWFYSANKAARILTGWLDREAQLGRVYQCGSRDIGGFPFRFEVRCKDISAALTDGSRVVSASLPDAVVVAQVWEPTFLIGEFSAPFVMNDGTLGSVTANWSLAHASIRGTPRSPQQISVAVNDLTLDRAGTDGQTERLASGHHVEFHSRIVDGSLREQPVLDFAARLVGVSAPGFHPLVRDAFDAEIDTRLRGLKDVAAKPWAARFREIQQANGRIEVKSARVRQGDWLATASGDLGLTPRGALNGELRVTVAGLDKLLNALGVQYLAQPSGSKINSALDALDKLAPGLGGMLREKAGAGVAAGLSALGDKTELEGRQAVTLPLRFDDGRAYLGPIALGETQALF